MKHTDKHTDRQTDRQSQPVNDRLVYITLAGAEVAVPVMTDR